MICVTLPVKDALEVLYSTLSLLQLRQEHHHLNREYSPPALNSAAIGKAFAPLCYAFQSSYFAA